VWPDKEADGSVANLTPGKGGSGRAKVLKLSKVCELNYKIFIFIKYVILFSACQKAQKRAHCKS